MTKKRFFEGMKESTDVVGGAKPQRVRVVTANQQLTTVRVSGCRCAKLLIVVVENSEQRVVVDVEDDKHWCSGSTQAAPPSDTSAYLSKIIAPDLRHVRARMQRGSCDRACVR